MRYNCTVKGEGRTARNAHYFVLDVEMPCGQVVTMTYFGNTTPQYVSEIGYMKSGDPYAKNIQPHVSRDRDTGRYKGGYRA